MIEFSLSKNMILLIYANFWSQGGRKLEYKVFGTNCKEIKLPLPSSEFSINPVKFSAAALLSLVAAYAYASLFLSPNVLQCDATSLTRTITEEALDILGILRNLEWNSPVFMTSSI